MTGAALGIGLACTVKLAEGERVALFDVLDTEGTASAKQSVARG